MDYRPISRLGRGGMGVVDLAHDAEGNRVALKRLTLHGSASEISFARQRLLREAEVLRRLHHPNIVGLIEVVDDGDEIVLVMPYLAGGNLAERVAQHGTAPPQDVELLGERLLGALAAAHQAGIIHRDIKPANVLYGSGGEPMLADFGVAHTWDQTRGLTVTGMVVGTPGYMPPEQARDEQLTPASDIFSLGATLLFAATGLGPYGSGDPGLLMVRAANDEVERLPKELPKRVRGWLASMLDPKPEHRPSAEALLTGVGLPPPRRWGRGGGSRAAVTVATLAGTAVLAAAFILPGLRDGGGADTGAGRPGATATTDGSSGGGATSGPEDSGYPGETGPDADAPTSSAAPPPETSPEASPRPATPTPLITDVTGELTKPGEPVTFTLPPMPEEDCTEADTTAEVAVRLRVDTGAIVRLDLVDPQDRVLGSDTTTRDHREAVVSTDQDVCPEPGVTLRAVITLLEPPRGAGGGSPYALSREGG